MEKSAYFMMPDGLSLFMEYPIMTKTSIWRASIILAFNYLISKMGKTTILLHYQHCSVTFKELFEKVMEKMILDKILRGTLSIN